MLLASYANIWPNGAVMVSASQLWLLAESGLSKNTWVRSMKRLEALKAVKRRRRRADDGTRLTIEYALTPDQAPQVVYPEKTWSTSRARIAAPTRYPKWVPGRGGRRNATKYPNQW